MQIPNVVELSRTTAHPPGAPADRWRSNRRLRMTHGAGDADLPDHARRAAVPGAERS
jgi:hypothetical protein